MTEEELRAIRDRLNNKQPLHPGEMWNVGEDLRQLLDHINSLPKTPPVFGKIDEAELANVEKAALDLPNLEDGHYKDEPAAVVSKVNDELLLYCYSHPYSDEGAKHADAVICILNALPKLLNTIRTQAALLRDLQEDSAAVREVLRLRRGIGDAVRESLDPSGRTSDVLVATRMILERLLREYKEEKE